MTEVIIEHQYDKLVNTIRHILSKYILKGMLQKYLYKFNKKQIRYSLCEINYYVKDGTRLLDRTFKGSITISDIKYLKYNIYNIHKNEKSIINKVKDSIDIDMVDPTIFDELKNENYIFKKIIERTVNLK